MPDKGYRVEGIILKRKNYAEADKILTIFTKQKGKICCLAKGIRKINSRRAPSLELFNQVKAYIVKGRGFDLITDVETIKNFPKLQKKLTTISIAYYLVELIEKLTAENQENLPVYQLLIEILEKIEKKGNLNQPEINDFQKILLISLGFGLPKTVNKRSLDEFIENILNKRINSRRFLW